MKKVLSLLLVALFMFTCFAGCRTNPVDEVSSTVSAPEILIEDAFAKPDNYASVILVTINPQFKLYLDAAGTVLAVEPVNDDAKSIEDKIVYENSNFEEVIQVLIVAADDGGFIKTDTNVDFKVVETLDENIDTTDVLDKCSESANKKLTEIKTEITASTEETNNTSSESESESSSSNNNSMDTSNTDTSSENESVSSSSSGDNTSESPSSKEDESASNESNDTSKGQESSESASASSKDEDSSSETQAPDCKHKKTLAAPISTGENVIDSSKLDTVYHIKRCADCDKELELEKHDVKDSKCTICGQSNFEMTSAYLISASVSTKDTLAVAKINDDGSLNYDLVIETCWWEANGEALDMWTFKISEAEMLKAIKAKFVMSNAEFKKLKSAGVYNCSLGEQTYSDGYFYCKDPAAGGPGSYSHIVKGYTDNKNGTFTVYYDYLEGGPDVEASERIHQYYYAVEYTYSGTSNLKINTEENSIIGWKPVVESLRVKSIKKVKDISGITKV